MSLGRIDHCRASAGQGLTQSGNTVAHRCSGLNLRAQELRRYLVLSSPAGAFFEDGLIGFGNQVARLGVDEEKLFLNA